MSAHLVKLSKQQAIESSIKFLSDAVAKKSIPGFQSSKTHEVLENTNGVEFIKYLHPIRNIETGDLQNTEQPLDIATTDGYFAVQTPKGIRYTRNGHFSLTPDGTLQTSDGHKVLNAGGGTITVMDQSSFSVANDGTLSTNAGVIGQIKVVRFSDEQNMQDEDLPGYYKTSQTEIIPENFRVMQGVLQGSNVNGVQAMIDFSLLSHKWLDTFKFHKQHNEFENKLHDSLVSTNHG
jgi:flagellar basal-body rod protein FlgF